MPWKPQAKQLNNNYHPTITTYIRFLVAKSLSKNRNKSRNPNRFHQIIITYSKSLAIKLSQFKSAQMSSRHRSLS
ncbi:hypothetical protein UE98_19070 [Burkholderia cenocepacia]|nr:hypothetical protein UE98_19070 [Burkholderia cenocepacia]